MYGFGLSENQKAGGEAHPNVPRVSAPMIPVDVLGFLEDIVASPKVRRGLRVVCGKLRLCAQAALRWDDLVRTPLMGVERVRRRGEKGVVGLRTKARGFEDRQQTLGRSLPGTKRGRGRLAEHPRPPRSLGSWS